MKRILAIKGHKERFSEVIEVLESLGGKNTANHKGDGFDGFFEGDGKYYISEDGEIISFHYEDLSEFITYSLEEFLEKYPYRIGEQVLLNGENCIISDMYWINEKVLYTVSFQDGDCEYNVGPYEFHI